MKRLEGRVAIITGSGKGIGRTVTLGMVQEGAVAVIADRDRVLTLEVQEEVEKSGHRALAIPTDVTCEDSVKDLVKKCMVELGRIDILVNSTTIDSICPIENMEEGEWDRVIGINLTSAFICSKAVVPILLDQGKGRILNMTSDKAMKGDKDASHCAASKAGIIGLTKALALELAPSGITVNTICQEDPNRRAVMPADSIGYEGETVINQSFGKPEIVGTAIFLSSDAAEYVTGQTIVLNGGSFMV